MRRKTKDQTQALRRKKMCPLVWHVLNDYGNAMLVMNWLTGEFRHIVK